MGRKTTEMIEENVPGLQDMNYQNKWIHCGPRIAEEEIPTPSWKSRPPGMEGLSSNSQ